MKALWFSISLFLVGIFSLSAQKLDTSPLISSGPLPEDVTTSPTKKYQDLLRSYRLNNSDDGRRSNQFLLESTYVLDQLLRSGYVVYNDPVGAYVNEVLAKVIDANPALREKSPRAYILKTPEVNAFALDQGIIFVSIGLLAQLENEAQLALILAHELAHIAESHVMDSFVASVKIDESVISTKDRDGGQFDLAETMKNQYSREQEMSADEIGAEYFLNTNYDFGSIIRVFDILRYGDLPFDEVPFDLAYLEELEVTLPAKCVIEAISPITPPEEDEENSTHPALDSRIVQLRNRLQNEPAEGRQTFMVSEERFRMARQRSRVALPRLFLEAQLLSEAIYTAFLLERTYGATEYAHEITGKALYGWARFRTNGQTFDVSSPRWKKVQGESQALFYAINKMNAEELTLLAIAYNYAYYQQQPDDTATKALLLDLFADLYLEHDISALDYFQQAPPTITSESPAAALAGENNSSTPSSDNKIDKIQRNQQGIERIASVWDKTVFSTVLNDSAFRTLAEEGFAYGKERQEEMAFFSPETRKEQAALRRYQKQREKRGRSLGIKRVTLVNPVFIHMDKAKWSDDYTVNFAESRQQLEVMKEVIAGCAKELDLSIRTLDPAKLRADDADLLNDIAQANSWISTQLDADEFIYQAYNRAAMDDFTEEYNSPYILSVIALSVPKFTLFGNWFSKGKSLLMVAVFDTRTGRRSFVKADFSNIYLNRTFLQSELYDALNQISKTN